MRSDESQLVALRRHEKVRRESIPLLADTYIHFGEIKKKSASHNTCRTWTGHKRARRKLAILKLALRESKSDRKRRTHKMCTSDKKLYNESGE